MTHHDYSLLASIYSHTHTAGTVGSLALMPPALGYLDFSGPVETLGEEIARTPDGRGRVFRLDFGTNHEGDHIELLTHVYMAGPDNILMERVDRERPWLRQQD